MQQLALQGDRVVVVDFNNLHDLHFFSCFTNMSTSLCIKCLKLGHC